MIKFLQLNRAIALLCATSLAWTIFGAMVVAMVRAAPQNISGGASAFQGQDIMGGAAIVFKRPQRVRDIVGGAAMLVVKRQKPAARPQEIARTRLPIAGAKLKWASRM